MAPLLCSSHGAQLTHRCCLQVLVDVMVVETNTPTHFDSIVRLLADNGMQMVVRQVQAALGRHAGHQTAAFTRQHMNVHHTDTWTVVLQDMNTWFIREGFTPSAQPASPAAQPVAVPPVRRR